MTLDGAGTRWIIPSATTHSFLSVLGAVRADVVYGMTLFLFVIGKSCIARWFIA
jgi:hypothetical protein